MSILSIQNLSIAFHQDQKAVEIVHNISFDVNPCETVALVGESGSGKSITAHSIMRLLPYPQAFHPGGKIIMEGKEILSLPQKAMRDIRGKDISMIFQEPMSALNPLHTIEKQVGEIIRQHQRCKKSEVKQKVIELLQQVKLRDIENKLKAYPHQLSGGQRQRVMIAMAIANKPTLLIADEPTTALDVTTQKDILDLLKELQDQYQMSILIITHDLGVVNYMANRVLVMHQGTIVEEGVTETLFAHPKHEYTRFLIDSHPDGDPVEVNKTNIKTILESDSLSVRFPKSKPLFGRPKDFFEALQSINLKIYKGQTLGIVGESGSGKSTFALAILKLIQSEGIIHYNGQDINRLTEKQMQSLRSCLQIVFQDPFTSLSPRMCIQEIIEEGLKVHETLSQEEMNVRVENILEEVGLSPEMKHRYPHEFSGGQRQRIAIARSLILNPELIFLDEPTSALDQAVQKQIINLLRKLQKERELTYVLISHDFNVIKALSHQIMVLKDGKIVEQDDANTILTSPNEQYTQNLLSATLC
jgi:microcin C transport system ATP-binding protein